jgi:primase-polymerase (primpol)-like protein
VADLGEVFDGATVDTGPMSALEELSTHPQWVCWALETRPGAAKPTKPPKNPHTGFGASHAKPSDWGTYEQAVAMAARRKFAGVGFVLSEEDDYTGIDLDKCRDPETGKIDLWADDIVSLGETYFEVNPSGTGLRAFVRGKIEKTVKCDTARVEVYRSLRYLTYTGDHIEGTPEDIRPAPTTLEWLMDRVAQFAPKVPIENHNIIQQ